ncbi:MAG TPA: hypothetical protein VIY90_23210 [Steroidobacteraceae bacterium]
MKMRLVLVVVAAASMLVSACGYVAEHTAPRKHAATSRSALAIRADALFWSTFHGGRYEDIPSALEALTGAYVASPNDDLTAAHIAWLHIWRLTERARLAPVPATITDDAVLARRYFEEAVALKPGEPRYMGFLASATLADASIHQDERLTRRGYFMMLDAIKAWPEFNLFTAGYVLSPQPAGSKNFQRALAWQWRDVDVCVGAKVDRENPDFARFMGLATTEGRKRACWNSWIAPHNFEGFFMNMGDMLVKAGDTQTARKIYANAKLSPTYSQWPFREALELRIRDADDNVRAFNAVTGTGSAADQRLMINSTFACMACHQQ